MNPDAPLILLEELFRSSKTTNTILNCMIYKRLTLYLMHIDMKMLHYVVTTQQGWITEMASYVKSIDRNHLLEAGLEGFYGHSSPWRTKLNPGFNIGTDFIANNRIPGIDFATLHSYPDQW